MATVREQIEAKIKEIETKAADDVAGLRSQLAAAEPWLDKEVAAFRQWFDELAAKVRAHL